MVDYFEFSSRFWVDIEDMTEAQQLWEMKYVIAHEGAHVAEGPGHGETFATAEGLRCASAD